MPDSGKMAHLVLINTSYEKTTNTVVQANNYLSAKKVLGVSLKSQKLELSERFRMLCILLVLVFSAVEIEIYITSFL